MIATNEIFYTNKCKEDSDFIFRVISVSATCIEEAKHLANLYHFNVSYSTMGISDAIRRLEEFFNGD